MRGTSALCAVCVSCMNGWFIGLLCVSIGGSSTSNSIYRKRNYHWTPSETHSGRMGQLSQKAAMEHGARRVSVLDLDVDCMGVVQ